MWRYRRWKETKMRGKIGWEGAPRVSVKSQPYWRLLKSSPWHFYIRVALVWNAILPHTVTRDYFCFSDMNVLQEFQMVLRNGTTCGLKQRKPEFSEAMRLAQCQTPDRKKAQEKPKFTTLNFYSCTVFASGMWENQDTKKKANVEININFLSTVQVTAFK